MDPARYGSNYAEIAGRLRDAVLGGIDDLGIMSPVVDPLVMNQPGTLSTEAQAFALMMFAAWRDWLNA